MKTTLLALLFLAPVLLNAQVGIGTTNPEAQLDIRSTNQASPSITDGILIPKVDEYPVANPTVAQDGMLIYATGNGSVGKGFYYWDNGITSWVLLGSGAGTDHDFYEEGSTVAPDDINDDIFTQGYLAIGKNTADYSLDVFSDISTRGINNILESADATIVDGIYNEVENTGSGGQRGVLNRLTGNSAGIQIATGNYVINTGDSEQYGSINSITGPGNGVHYGNRNFLNGLGTGVHYGTFNRLEGAGAGEQYGTRNEIVNSEDANHHGISNILSGNGAGQHYGTYTELSGSGGGAQYGSSHIITNSGDERHYGVSNTLVGTGLGAHYGIVNTLAGAGMGNQIGTISVIGNTGDGDHYGSFSQLTGSGSGDKIGAFVTIPQTSGGTHYGVRSEVSKPGSYAGYFRGAVAIGTNNFNTYTFPPSRGAADQVMQTDGSGNLSWVDADSFAPILNARNGLTLNGTNVELGGFLSQNTSILLGASNLRFNLGVSGNFIIEDSGTDIFQVNGLGVTDIGNDLVWHDGTITGTVLGAFIDDGDDGRFYLNENNAISVDLDANSQFVFNEQGLDRNFRIESNTNANMFLIDAGTDRLGVREQTPLTDIHLKQSTLSSNTAGGMTFESSNTTERWKVYHSGIHFSFAENGVRRAYVEGATGNYVTTSDRRLKKNIAKLNSVLQPLNEINLYQFHYKDQRASDKKVIGVMAQEIQTHFPELVSTTEEGTLGVSYDGLSVIALKAIKEQQQIIDQQQSEIDALKQEMETIKLLLKNK